MIHDPKSNPESTQHTLEATLLKVEGRSLHLTVFVTPAITILVLKYIKCSRGFEYPKYRSRTSVFKCSGMTVFATVVAKGWKLTIVIAVLQYVFWWSFRSCVSCTTCACKISFTCCISSNLSSMARIIRFWPKFAAMASCVYVPPQLRTW